MTKTIEIRPNYIFFATSGNYESTTQPAEIIVELAELSDKHKINKIILDISQMKRIPPVMDRYELGEMAAKVWGHKIRIAIVAKPSEITGFFENVVVNRGAVLKVLPTIELAELWLDEIDAKE